MEIHGFQKMTLLDYPGKVACTVFTGGCNMRCPFCHNAFLVTELSHSEHFSQQEILNLIASRKKLLDGVAVTGGEPLLTEDTLDFLARLKDLGLAVKLDTNGSFPDRLQRAVREGLVDYVAMDIKNAPQAYAATAGVPGLALEPIRESVRFLLSGAVDYEFRTTIVAEYHSLEDMEAIGRWIQGARRYYLQSFVDSGNLICQGLHGVNKASMLALRDTAQKYISCVEIRGI